MQNKNTTNNINTKEKRHQQNIGEVQNVVENETIEGMASSLHTYFRGNTNELVYRPGIAQMNYNMEDISTTLHNHFLIRA
jgi:hypothetical protein